MTNGRSISESGERRQNDLFSKASLDQVIQHSKTGHFLPDSIVCTGEQLGECVYLVLRGKCDHRSKSRSGEPRVIESFGVGDTFGGVVNGLPDRLATEVVAVEDSVVMAMRVEDLAKIGAATAGQEVFTPDKLPDATNTTFYFSGSKNRMVNLVFLGDRLPAQKIAESVASQLRVETGESVVLVEFIAGETVGSTRPGKYEHKLDGLATLPGDTFRDELGLYRLRLKLSAEPPDPEVTGELFRKLRRRFRSVLVSLPAGKMPDSYLQACILKSDVTHFFLRPAEEDLLRLDLQLHELRSQAKSPVPLDLKAVLCLAQNEPAGTFDEQIIDIGMPSPALIRGCPVPDRPGEPVPRGGVDKGVFIADVRRLARGIGDCLVGLALSSGGAKGFAHIGVIQVLEENGLDVDVVVGASMGAYVGSIWTCGHDGGTLEGLAREMEVKRAMWGLIDPVIIPWQGILRGYAVKRRLQRSIGTSQFSDLVKPFRVVAAHLDTMARKIFSTGEVATAVHASIAVPGICIPVRIGGEVYVDGGIVDPVPTDVLQEMGVRKIIAVNTIPTSERIQQCLQAEHDLARLHPKKSRSFIRKMLPSKMYINHYTDGNVLEILMHSTHGAQMRLAEASSRRADVDLRPDICDDRWMDFRNPGLYIKAGREVALRHLDELKSLINGTGATHEHEPAPKTLANAV